MTKEQYQDTFHGIVKAGELNDKTVVHNRWWRDMYLNLYFDDQLWANMIRGAKWLQQVDWTHINNLVLDWTGPNKQMHQATQAIQHSTTMHFRTFP